MAYLSSLCCIMLWPNGAIDRSVTRHFDLFNLICKSEGEDRDWYKANGSMDEEEMSSSYLSFRLGPWVAIKRWRECVWDSTAASGTAPLAQLKSSLRGAIFSLMIVVLVVVVVLVLMVLLLRWWHETRTANGLGHKCAINCITQTVHWALSTEQHWVFFTRWLVTVMTSGHSWRALRVWAQQVFRLLRGSVALRSPHSLTLYPWAFHCRWDTDLIWHATADSSDSAVSLTWTAAAATRTISWQL